MQKKSKVSAVVAGMAGLAAAVAIYDKVSGEKSVVKRLANALLSSNQSVHVEEVPYLNLRTGDHLVTLESGFAHHGIWTGNDVIQWDNDPEDQGKVTVHRLPLDVFLAQGSPNWLQLYKSKKVLLRALKEDSPAKYERREILKRAESQLGTEKNELTSRNCEQFVRWCRAGD